MLESVAHLCLYKFRSMTWARARWASDHGARGPPLSPLRGLSAAHQAGRSASVAQRGAGKMSLVGPHLEDPRYVARYTLAHRAILAVRPGITSAAPLAYRHEEALLTGPDWEEIMSPRCGRPSPPLTWPGWRSGHWSATWG